MECLPAVTNLAGTCLGCLSPFIISKISILFNFQEKEDSLRKAKEDLLMVKNSIEDELKKADMEGKSPVAKVVKWLKEVGELEIKGNCLESDLRTNNRRLHGCCLNCCLRYRTGKEMMLVLDEIHQLAVAGNSLQGKAAETRQKSVEEIPSPVIRDQKAANDIMGQIVHLLKDGQVGRFGIWGMGGVGKTTIMKNLNNNIRLIPSAPVFSIVIWVTVSKELDMRRIQSQVAERLCLELSEETLERRAIRLFERLKKEVNFLLFLDDVWEEIDLDKVAIPHGEAHKGCKIIITTRLLDICRAMKTDRDIKVDVLSDEESWKLFKRNAGDVVDLKLIGSHAKSVAKECRGLPLAIITVARAMRGKNRVELWRNALSELRRSAPQITGLEREVFLHLKWSYDSLQGTNIKPCFLYCSMFPEDFSIGISELVEYWIAEGFIDGSQNLDESYNKGFSIIETLKDSCLLEHGEHDDTVKMHDVVRDVAIWIGSTQEVENKFFVRSGMGLTEMPEDDIGKSYRRISLMRNRISSLPENSKCSKVCTLLLQENPLKEIANGFFRECRALRVLNLSGSELQHLPASLGGLGDLCALILRDCVSLEELPSLEGLMKLQYLDLSGARLHRELPRGFEKLRNLRTLSLARTYHLQNIQAGVMSTFSKLEELNMAFSAYNWDVLDEIAEDSAPIDDLKSLSNLTAIWIRINSIKFLSGDLSWLTGLREFSICVGSRSYDASYLATQHDERRVILDSVEIHGCFKELLANASALVLKGCTGISELSKLVAGSGDDMGSLKALTAIDCSGLKTLIRYEEITQGGMFPNLVELNLHRLRGFFSISQGLPSCKH